MIIKNGKTISNTTATNTGAFRITTYYKWQWWANQKLGDGVGDGGIIFYSENGQGQETRVAQFPDLKMENVGDLIDAINGTKSTAEAESLIKELYEIIEPKQIKSIAEKTVQALEYFKHVKDIGDAAKIKLEASSEKDPLPPNSTVCAYCKLTPHTQQDGTPAYITGRNGEVIDTIKRNPVNNKLDTVPTKPVSTKSNTSSKKHN